MNRVFVLTCIVCCLIVAVGARGSAGGDWRMAWEYQPQQPPAPAFQGGLSTGKDLPGVEPFPYDHAFCPVVAGGRVLFSSSSEQAVFCLDAGTGERQWRFFADGPVRIRPTIAADRVFFGSDDGNVYCLDLDTGEPVWKYRIAPGNQRAIGSGRMISAWPVRTRVVVEDGIVYCGAGLLPPLGTFLCALHSEKGRPVWQTRIPYSPHGEILVDGERLLVATGRTSPAEFHRADGTPLVPQPNPRRASGSSFLGRAGELVYWGPCESGLLHVRVSAEPVPGIPAGLADAVITGRVVGIRGSALAADESMVYVLRDDSLLAFDKAAFVRIAGQFGFGLPAYAKQAPWVKQGWGIAAAGQALREDARLFDELQPAVVWKADLDAAASSLAIDNGRLFCGGQDFFEICDAASGKSSGRFAVAGNALSLVAADDGAWVGTDRGRLYGFDIHSGRQTVTHLPESQDPFPEDAEIRGTAKSLVDQADTNQGFCLILGTDPFALAREVARQSEFHVVVVERDADAVNAARVQLAAAGAYGTRVVVHHAANGPLDYPEYFANLIIISKLEAMDDLSTVLPLLQPYGGTIAIRRPQRPEWASPELSEWKAIVDASGYIWNVARRQPLAGAGQWTQMYADPAGTVSSGDRLTGPALSLQWYGPPGAEDVVERHAVAMPPLFKDGRLFVAGLYDTVQAVDAYNGTNLWKVTVPEAMRMMLSHQAGFMAAGDDVLFVAGDAGCWMLDASNGETLHRFHGPRPDDDWGYVGVVGDLLLGSNQSPAADGYSSGRVRPGYGFQVSARDLLSRPAVSRNLFVHGIADRQLRWQYDVGSVILNSSIAVGEGQVFFVESRNPTVVQDSRGAASLPEFFQRDARLVAVDLKTGGELWSQPLGRLSDEPGDRHEHILFLSYSDGVLLTTRTGHIGQLLAYRLEARDATDGGMKWSQTFQSKHRVYAPLSYGKNGQQSHPCIIAGRVYLLSHITEALLSFDLQTGEMQAAPEFFDFWIHSKTCAVPTASASGLFFRRDSCHMLDLPTGQTIDLTGVTRPSCWMSILPAGGLILMPEASAGCTCGFALQTSIALRSRRE